MSRVLAEPRLCGLKAGELYRFPANSGVAYIEPERDFDDNLRYPLQPAHWQRGDIFMFLEWKLTSGGRIQYPVFLSKNATVVCPSNGLYESLKRTLVEIRE